MTSWWFQRIWKIWRSNWIISPGSGENKKLFETTTLEYMGYTMGCIGQYGVMFWEQLPRVPSQGYPDCPLDFCPWYFGIPKICSVYITKSTQGSELKFWQGVFPGIPRSEVHDFTTKGAKQKQNKKLRNTYGMAKKQGFATSSGDFCFPLLTFIFVPSFGYSDTKIAPVLEALGK